MRFKTISAIQQDISITHSVVEWHLTCDWWLLHPIKNPPPSTLQHTHPPTAFPGVNDSAPQWFSGPDKNRWAQGPSSVTMPHSNNERFIWPFVRCSGSHWREGGAINREGRAAAHKWLDLRWKNTEAGVFPPNGQRGEFDSHGEEMCTHSQVNHNLERLERIRTFWAKRKNL